MSVWRGTTAVLVLWLGNAGILRGQPPTSAKVEAIPLELKAPDRYQVYSILEPVRRVTVTAPADGILRSLEFPVGAAVRENQEIGQLDRTEAAARLRIAKANVKEAEAALKASPAAVVLQAKVEAAQALAEVAAFELDRCTLRAPFGGRLLEVGVSPGQFVSKGAKIAELADVSSLRVLVPFPRSAVAVGNNVEVNVEGQVVAGKVQATLPLPESLGVLRELTTAFAAALVILPNLKGELEPGQRVLGPTLPTSPIATIPSRALHEPARGAAGGPTVQLIRNEYVVTLPVRVLGHPGPERVQVSGLLRPADALIVSSSVPLLAGTLIRFSGEGGEGIEATNPNPSEGGEVAGITPPRVGARINAGATPKVRTAPRTPPRPTSGPTTTPKAAAPPF